MANLHLTYRPDAVAVVAFDQAGSKANVLNAGLWAELETALESLSARTDLRGLVLASAKPDIFIAGADLKVLASAGPDDPGVRAFLDMGLRVLAKLEGLPFPTAAAIDGAALGGGLEVALACDLRIAGPNPKLRLGLPEVTLGLIPGWGGTQRLPRLIGVPEAVAQVSTGRQINREEAVRLLLADAAVPTSEGLVDEAARLLLASPPEPSARERKRLPILDGNGTTGKGLSAPESAAAAEGRRVVEEGAVLPFSEGIALETEAFMRLAGSDESKRLIGAFFASRKK